MRALLCGCGLAALACVVRGDENQWWVPLGPPPQAAPKRISGGAGIPPLPLPATPLRRSERKREPRPPLLVGKLVWGEAGEYRYDSGETRAISDWNLCPDDVAQLMRKAGRWFGLNYGTQPVSLATLDPDPAQTPILFFSGVRALRLDEGAFQTLRAYVARGGMLVLDSVAGSPYFTASALDLAARLVPGERVREIPLDHPLYHMLEDATVVRYPRNRDGDRPVLEGVYQGSRIAVLVSRYGLGCGWDNREVPLLPEAVFYDPESATRLGVNLVAYGIGYADAARTEAQPELFGSEDELPPSDELVFAQLKHEGAWNVHPGAAAALLRVLRAESALGVRLKRVGVDPASDALDGYACLYLEGLDDFAWSEAALARLRAYLDRGGTLLVNNGLGLATFDRAVRRELARLLPGAALQRTPAEHPVFSALLPLGEVRYTAAALQAQPGLSEAVLEGIVLEGDLRVLYSPYDLACGWLGCDYPLARAYDRDSAIRLGMNLFVYAMTH